jgi:hypothetical protein
MIGGNGVMDKALVPVALGSPWIKSSTNFPEMFLKGFYFLFKSHFGIFNSVR